METFFIILSILVGVSSAVGALLVAKKLSGGPSKEETAALKSESEQLGDKLKGAVEIKDGCFSKSQLATLTTQTEQFVEAL